jgi:hypothetical protein
MKGSDHRTLHLPLLVVAALAVVLLLPALAGAAGTAAPAQHLGGGWTPALSRIAGDGIGDDPGSWQNSYPWSMSMFGGDLYIGTGRVGCTSSVMSLMSGPMAGGAGVPLPGGFIPGNAPQAPPVSSFLSPDGTSVTDVAKYTAFNATSRAEIWRLHCGQWTRVWQAPLIDSYLTGAPPASAAAILGLRGMAVMTDKYGAKALYAAAGGFSFALQQPLLMRSLDGVTWTPCYSPVDPTTGLPLMGRESRAIFAHHGKLYVGVGPAELRSPVKAGVWASDEPTNPASWKKVIDFPTLDPTNNNVLSFATLYGRLYAGTANVTGFQVWRSNVCDPMGNTDWTRVVTGGAGSTANEWAGTMKVFNGAVYVGSMHVPGISGSTQLKGFDLIRIWPSGSWQLVIGDPRLAETPAGARMMSPVSGKPSGMGNPLNLYCWSLAVHGGRLYLGTFDLTSMLKFADPTGAQVAAMLGLTVEQVQALYAGAGADLYRTWDGRWWGTVTRTGFGEQYCYGFRNIVAAPYRLYFGLSNPFYGCQVWQLRSLW